MIKAKKKFAGDQKIFYYSNVMFHKIHSFTLTDHTRSTSTLRSCDFCLISLAFSGMQQRFHYEKSTI